jgi:hypothetical protein
MVWTFATAATRHLASTPIIYFLAHTPPTWRMRSVKGAFHVVNDTIKQN